MFVVIPAKKRLSSPSRHLRAGALVLGLLTLFSGTSVFASDGAGLTNGGLEAPYLPAVSSAHSQSAKAKISGETADGWKDNSAWAEVVAHYSRESVDVRSGESAQRIDITSIHNGRLQFAQPVVLEPGKVYRGSMWMRSSGFVIADLRLQQRGAPFRTITAQRVAISPEWREFEVHGAVTEPTEALLMLSIQGTGDTSATVWIDDAQWLDMNDVDQSAPGNVGNMLNNGSFETDLSGGWGVWVREFNRLQDAIGSEFADDRPVMDTQTAVDGSQSLRIDIPYARAAVITSPWVPFNFNRAHTASVALKADKPTSGYLIIEGKPDITKQITIGTEWERHSISAVLPYAPSTRFTIRFWPNEAVTVWADGAQLEESETATADYLAPYPVELGLGVPRAGGIVFDGESAPVVITLGGEPLPEGTRLLWQITDLLGGTTELAAIALPAFNAAAETPVRLETSLAPDTERPRGMFKVRGFVADERGQALSAPVEVIFARLPHPRDLAPERSFFGTHVHLTPELIEIARASGFRWLRLHDASNLTKWRYVEEKKDTFVYQDEGVDAALEAGMAILGMLDGAPPWATRNPGVLVGNHSVYNLPDIDGGMDYWGRYVRNTVTHYKGRINDWEVWNEPWAVGLFNVPADLYAQLLMRAYDETKAVNPEAIVVGVNSVAHSSMGDNFTAAVLAITGLRYFDIFSIHDYNPSLYGGNDDPAQRYVSKFDALMSKYGTPKPIWNTEGASGATPSWYWANEGEELFIRRLMAHIIRFDVAQIAAGVERFFYYSLYHHQGITPVGFTALEHDRTIRPVIAASAVLASFIDGASYKGRIVPQAGLEGYRFLQDDGTAVLVIWSESTKAHSYSAPAGMVIRDVLGNLLPATVEIGEVPVYVVGAAGLSE